MGIQPLPGVAAAAALDGTEGAVLIQDGQVVQAPLSDALAAGGVTARLGADNTFTGGRNTFANLISLGVPQAVTIAGDVITVTESYISVSTEAAAASDDLKTINGGGIGDLLFVRAASNSNFVTLKHNAAGGNLKLGADRTLSGARDYAVLIYDGSFWCLLAFSDNA